MAVLLARCVPVARAVDGCAVDLEPVAHGAEALDLPLGNGAIRTWANIDQEIPVAADDLDHFMDHLSGVFFLMRVVVRLLRRQVTERGSKGRATLPLRTELGESKIVFFAATDALGPVQFAALVVEIDGLAAPRTVVHEIRDHEAELIVEILDFGLGDSLRHLVPVPRPKGNVVDPKKIGLVFFFDFLPAGHIVVRKGLIQIEGAVERSRLGMELDLLSDVGMRLAIGHIAFRAEIHVVALAMGGRRVFEPAFADGRAEFAHEVTLRPFVHRIPRGEVGIPVRPAIVVLGGEHHILGPDFIKKRRPGLGIPLLGLEMIHHILVAKLGRRCSEALLQQGIEMLGVGVDRLWNLLGITSVALYVAQHAVGSPVNEDADLPIIEPRRNRHFLKGFPRAVVGIRSAGGKASQPRGEAKYDDGFHVVLAKHG